MQLFRTLGVCGLLPLLWKTWIMIPGIICYVNRFIVKVSNSKSAMRSVNTSENSADHYACDGYPLEHFNCTAGCSRNLSCGVSINMQAYQDYELVR